MEQTNWMPCSNNHLGNQIAYGDWFLLLVRFRQPATLERFQQRPEPEEFVGCRSIVEDPPEVASDLGKLLAYLSKTRGVRMR